MTGIVRHFPSKASALSAVALASLISCQSGAPYREVEPTPAEERIGALLESLLLGEMYGHQGDNAGAWEHYYQASLLTPNPQVAARAVEIALWVKDYGRLEQTARRWRQLRPRDPRPLRVLGVALAAQGRVEEAVEAYAESMARAAEKEDAGMREIESTLAISAAEEARLPVLRALAARAPGNAHAGYYHAREAYRTGELAEARAAIRAAVAQRAQWSRAVLLEAKILLELRAGDEAIARLRAALRQPLQGAQQVRQVLADTLLQQQRYPQAREEYRQLIEADPAHPNWRFALGFIAMLSQDWAAARKHFASLREQARPLRGQRDAGLNRSVGAYFLGLVEEQAGDAQEAMRLYAQVEERDYVGALGTERYYQQAQSRISKLLLESDIALARRHLQRSRGRSRRDENIVFLYTVEATLLQDNGLHRDSFRLLTQALAQYPGDESLLYQRALLAGVMGRHAELERDLRALLMGKPDHPHALNALGYTWADLGRNLEQARDYIERAHAQLPDDASIIDSLGWVHYRLGNLDRAERLLREALARRAGDAEILAHLIEVVWTRGRHEEARQLYRGLMERAPDSPFLDPLAERLAL